MPAPYTPSTIAAIRVQARRRVGTRTIAALLGWDEQQLLRVARKHDITLVRSKPVEAAVVAPAPPSPTPEPVKAPIVKKIALPAGKLKLDAGARTVSFFGVASSRLTKTQMLVFTALAELSAPMVPERFSARIGLTPKAIKIHMTNLRRLIAPLGLDITPGRHGYALRMVPR